eukprot:scaffold211837_cov79-Attheya_sp.AAC.5
MNAGMTDRPVPTDARMMTAANAAPQGSTAAATCYSKSIFTAMGHRATITTPSSNDRHEWEHDCSPSPSDTNQLQGTK